VAKDGNKTPLKKNSRPRLYKALFRAFWLPYMAIGIFVFIQVAKKRKKSVHRAPKILWSREAKEEIEGRELRLPP